MNVTFVFILLFLFLNQKVFAGKPVNGIIFRRDTASTLKFSGTEKKNNKQFTLSPNDKSAITDQALQTSAVLLDTIIPIADLATHPLTGTFQLIQWKTYRPKYFLVGLKQLVYKKRFEVHARMPCIVFGFHQPFVNFAGQQSHEVEKLFDLIQNLCKAVSCISYLPLTEGQNFDPNVYHNLHFRSHFFYEQTSEDIQFPPHWYFIHNSNAPSPTAENKMIIDSNNIVLFQNSVTEATNFVYKLVDGFVKHFSIVTTPRDNELARFGKVADFVDTTIPKTNTKSLEQFNFCEIEFVGNTRTFALTNNNKLGEGGNGEVILGKNLSLLKRVAVKLGANKYEHPSHVKIYDGMKEHLTKQYAGSPVPIPVPIPMPGGTHLKIRDSVSPSYKYAMESLGPNLDNEAILKFCRKFPIICYQEIVLQMLDRVYTLQEIGWIHRDLKTGNFLFGLRHLKQTVYLADFGTAQNFAAILEEYPVQPTNQAEAGTRLFASMDTHRGLQVSWKDEYESLGYGIIRLVHYLPFYSETHEEYLAEKMSLNDNFWGGFPGGMRMKEYFAHLRGVKYGEKPDYQFLVECIKRAILEGGDEGNRANFKTDTTLFGINLRSWSQIPVIKYKNFGKPRGIKAAKLSKVKQTLFIDEKLLFRSSQNQDDLYYTDYVATTGKENDEYVMILPGIEETVSLLCTHGKLPLFLCIMIVDDVNGNSLLRKGNCVSTYVRSTMSRNEFESNVLQSGKLNNLVYRAIDSEAQNSDSITNVAVPLGNFTDAMVQQYRATMLDIARRLMPHQSPSN